MTPLLDNPLYGGHKGFYELVKRRGLKVVRHDEAYYLPWNQGMRDYKNPIEISGLKVKQGKLFAVVNGEEHHISLPQSKIVALVNIVKAAKDKFQ